MLDFPQPPSPQIVMETFWGLSIVWDEASEMGGKRRDGLLVPSF